MNNKHLVDYSESPFSKVIATKKHVKNVLDIVYKKCNIDLNTPVSKKICIELRTWKKFIRRQYIKSLTYERLCHFCNFSLEDTRKGIHYLDDIEYPKVPLDFDCNEGVRLDAGIINEGRVRSRIVEYTNKDKEILKIIRYYARKVIGDKFCASERIDKRDDTVCLSFPPIFAKHFLKIGVNGNKSHTNIKVPSYILNNKDYHKIWWKANISEEASIYPFVLSTKRGFYLTPRIQLNRVKAVHIWNKNFQKEITYYHKDLPYEDLRSLKINSLHLINDEVYMLSTFDINVKPYFSKLYINKKFQSTATYTILIYILDDLEKYLDNVGFELDRHKSQFELLLNNRGKLTKEKIRDTIIKFYKLVPNYLRGIKRIKTNKWLTEEDKAELMDKEDVEANYCSTFRKRGFWKNPIT